MCRPNWVRCFPGYDNDSLCFTQGSVETYLGYGEKRQLSFVANLVLFTTVKEFGKSVAI